MKSLDPSARRAFVELAEDDDAVSDVVGAILLVALTVIVTTAFAGVLIAAMPSPQEPLAAKLEAGWAQDCHDGAGQVAVRPFVRHLGGEPLPRATTTVNVEVQAFQGIYISTDLDGQFLDDGKLSIGESWQAPAEILPADALGIIDLYAHRQEAELFFTAHAATPQHLPCTEASS